MCSQGPTGLRDEWQDKTIKFGRNKPFAIYSSVQNLFYIAALNHIRTQTLLALNIRVQSILEFKASNIT